jgi:NitT/TauT family transport system permease protein
MMSIAGSTFQTDKVFVGIILLAGFGYLLTELLKRLEARFESWRPERN